MFKEDSLRLIGRFSCRLDVCLISAFVSCSRFGQIFMVDKDTVIMDVREREEYEAGHIPNSISIPLAEIGQSDLSFLNGKKIIVYCTSGIRSANAARLLRKKGIKGVIDFSGGIKVWLKNGGRLDFQLNEATK
ncbi:MAG: rhodanese-like domain-containing protein [Deltaproteobacteria bacterium]|nr:rhodanese-like domain-containing protein [Deltaproteobacteria bacterium]